MLQGLVANDLRGWKERISCMKTLRIVLLCSFLQLLLMAAVNGHDIVVRQLLETGQADINARDTGAEYACH